MNLITRIILVVLIVALSLIITTRAFAQVLGADLRVFTVPQGGTGWPSIQSGTVIYGNGTNRVSTTTAGTAGQVLMLSNGIPTWASTTTTAGDGVGNWFTPSTFGPTAVSATTTAIRSTNGLMASSTSYLTSLFVGDATTTALNASGQVDFDSLTDALIVTGNTGVLAEYAGTGACAAGQAITALNALGASTCSPFSTFAYPYTPTTSFGTAANSTSTLQLLTAGLTASSTVRFGVAGQTLSLIMDSLGRIGLGTASPAATQGITIATSTVFSGTQFAGSYASSTAATAYTIDWDTGNTQRIMLTGNSFIDINATSSKPRDGGKYILKVCNTGPFTGTFINIGQLNWTSGTTSISTTASTTMIGMIYDGRVGRYDIIASTTVATAQSCKV